MTSYSVFQGGLWVIEGVSSCILYAGNVKPSSLKASGDSALYFLNYVSQVTLNICGHQQNFIDVHNYTLYCTVYIQYL